MNQQPPDVIDISSWRQRVDFERIAAFGVKGVIIRQTVSHLYADLASMYNTRWAIAAGLWVGGYGVMHPAYSAVFQADCFGQLCHARDFPPALDCERLYDQHPHKLARQYLIWLERVREDMCMTPMIYTRKYWWDKYIHPYFNYTQSYPLWVAHYTTRSEPYIPKWWSTWDMWQYTNVGRVPGINDHFDFNRVNPDGKLARILSTTGRTQSSRDD